MKNRSYQVLISLSLYLKEAFNISITPLDLNSELIKLIWELKIHFKSSFPHSGLRALGHYNFLDELLY